MSERIWRSGLAAALVFLLASCASTPKPTTSQTDLVQAYVAAYNVRDLQAMSALMHPDIEWLSIEASGIETLADGKEDLVGQMQAYLATSDTVSELGDIATNGAFVSGIETARWMGADGMQKAQSAMAVYEIEDNLIRRVWYFPASP